MTRTTTAAGPLVLILTALIAANAAAQPDDAAEWRAAFAKGSELEAKADYAQAAKHYERALALAPRVFGPNHVNTGITLNNLANVYRSQGRSAAAEPLYRRAMAIDERVYGPDHPEVATDLNNLAGVYQDQGKYAEAERVHTRALAIREKALGPNHLDTAFSLVNLAILYTDRGKYAEAEPLYRRALAIREKALGPNHPDVATSLNGLAALADRRGQFGEAERLLRQALAITEKALPPGHPDVATSVDNLAGILERQGKTAEAEPLYRRALVSREKALGPDHPDVATSLIHLAGLAKNQSKYSEAEPLYRRALTIREKALGPDHAQTAAVVDILAALNRDVGKGAEAEALFRRALAIREKALGPDHPVVATTLSGLGLLYWSQGKSSQAEAAHRRALTIQEKALGRDHVDVADSLNNLAILSTEAGRYAEAEPLYRRALAIWEAALTPDHRHVAEGVNNLAYTYQLQGKLGEAEPLHRRALTIKERTLGPDHPATGQSLNNLAVLEVVRQNWAEAADLADRERRGARRFVARELPAMPEADQLAFLGAGDYRRSLHIALALGLLRRADPAIADRSASWVLNGKSVSHQALAERALLERDAADPARRELVRQLQEARRRHAVLAMTGARPGQEARRGEDLRNLDAERAELERKLAAAGGTAAAAADPWVGLDAVRRALPADGTLVEIARFHTYDFAKGQLLSPRYAAWVVPPAGAGSVQVVDLGPASEIENAVEALRTTLAKAARPDGPIRTQGEPEAEAALRRPLDALAKLVLHPLLPHLTGRPKVLLSPDGELWLVPWAALPLPDGRYAVEAHAVTLLASGRDVAAPRAARHDNAGPPAVVADPDFDLPAAEAAARVKTLLPGRPPVPDGLRGLAASTWLPTAARLPGTATEAAAIRPALQKLGGREPRLYLGGDALEGVVKAMKGPRVAVFSTHGFALADQEVARDVGTKPVAKNDGSPQNPLLRCGLLLAGCNRRGDGADDDGVLTGLEIVGTDLRGTELVVLSACETGLGTVRSGEGVAGLRQAFQLAGAQSVVATLWQVPDRESAKLMTAFFDNLAAGKGKADALRAAQLAQIEARRQRNAAAHPFFWAAYTLTGQ
ncbi:MAG: tetratricopeptide repeat protein [Gemmataceae bacterium]